MWVLGITSANALAKATAKPPTHKAKAAGKGAPSAGTTADLQEASDSNRSDSTNNETNPAADPGAVTAQTRTLEEFCTVLWQNYVELGTAVDSVSCELWFCYIKFPGRASRAIPSKRSQTKAP